MQAATGPLAGTGRIADDLYMIAHDENTGRPLIGPRLLGTGLAAALLAELMLAGGLVLHNGRVGGVTLTSGMVMACRAKIADDLARHVHEVVAAEPQLHPVQVWLEFLACDAARNVAFRLGQARLPGACAPQAALEGCAVGPGRPGLGIRAADPRMPRGGPGPHVLSRPRCPGRTRGGRRAQLPHDRAPPGRAQCRGRHPAA